LIESESELKTNFKISTKDLNSSMQKIESDGALSFHLRLSELKALETEISDFIMKRFKE
jgi:hypothetical protein